MHLNMKLQILLYHVMIAGRSVAAHHYMGVMTVISMNNGKVLNIEPMTRACKAFSKYRHLNQSSQEEYKV